MQRFLALLFALVSVSVFGAAGDLKFTQRNPTDTGFIERTVAAQASALLSFSAGGLPTTIAPSALPVSAAMQTALDAKASSTHSHSASEITSGTLAADRLATGSALQVLRRNAANTALEFATISGGGGDMYRATYDTNADNVVDSAAAAPWSGITSKPTTLSGYGITDAQPADSDLSSIAALTTTAFGRSLLAQADAAAARSLIGAGTSSFDGTFGSLTGRPTTRTGYGITDAAATGPVTGSGLTMATSRILGRSSSGTGAPEEITVGSGLSLSAGTLTATGGGGPATDVWIVAVSDETTELSSGVDKVRFRAPRAATLTAVRASVGVASTSGLVTLDVNEAGTSVFSTTLTIDSAEKSSTTAATAAVISDSAIADDAEISFDVDTAGTGAKGLKVALYVTY